MGNIIILKGLFGYIIYVHIIKNTCFKDLNSTNAKQEYSWLTLCSLLGIRLNTQHHPRYLCTQQYVGY